MKLDSCVFVRKFMLDGVKEKQYTKNVSFSLSSAYFNKYMNVDVEWFHRWKNTHFCSTFKMK